MGIFIVLLAGAAGLGYSLYITIKSGAVDAGVVSCPSAGQCIWTAHIHAYLPISICGEDYRLPIEIGALTGPHTHEEKNIAHWHDKLPYDKKTKEIMDAAPLTLGAFFDAIEVPFNSDRIANKKNSDLCPDGSKGITKVLVNGTIVENPREYIWKNHDIIMIFFDSRTPLETERKAAEAPLTFPTLGRG